MGGGMCVFRHLALVPEQREGLLLLLLAVVVFFSGHGHCVLSTYSSNTYSTHKWIDPATTGLASDTHHFERLIAPSFSATAKTTTTATATAAAAAAVTATATAAAAAAANTVTTTPQRQQKPHILAILMDDLGWAEVGWHRNYTIGNVNVPTTREVNTPHLDSLVASGIELDRHYAYKCCSPTRSAVQSGRHPMHVNALNSAAEISNRSDPVSGFAGIPRNMTGLGVKMAAAGYKTHFVG